MATPTLPYPRADALINVGDKRRLCIGRLFNAGVQLDPTAFTLTTTMQLTVNGAPSGAAVSAITATVITDPADGTKKAVDLRIDATGLAAGVWHWELHASGTVDSQPMNIVPSGGFVTLVARVVEP